MSVHNPAVHTVPVPSICEPMLIAGIVLFCVLLSRRKLSRGSDPLYRENAASLMLGNVGMILCLVIMGLVMAINLWPMA